LNVRGPLHVFLVLHQDRYLGATPLAQQQAELEHHVLAGPVLLLVRLAADVALIVRRREHDRETHVLARLLLEVLDDGLAFRG